MNTNNVKVLPEGKKKKGFSAINLKKIYWKSLIFKIFKLIGKVFAGAIVLSFLGHMAPELRQQIPSFYQIIDFLLSGLEWFCSQFPL